MLRLFILMAIRASIVSSGIKDTAVVVEGEVKILQLSSTDLHELHMCLCTDAYTNCLFQGFGNKKVTANHSEPSHGSSAAYSNVYLCILLGADLECHRKQRDTHTNKTFLNTGQSFSLHNESCDLKCVDVILGVTVKNLTINTDKINAGVCPVIFTTNSQTTINTTTIILIVVASIVVVVFITVIVVICARIKRKKQLNTLVFRAAKMEPSSYGDHDKTAGLYAVSSEISGFPDLDNAQESLYYEIEKDKLNTKESRQDTELQTDNVYTHLHEETEQVVNTYDVLPRSDSQF